MQNLIQYKTELLNKEKEIKTIDSKIIDTYLKVNRLLRNKEFIKAIDILYPLSNVRRTLINELDTLKSKCKHELVIRKDNDTKCLICGKNTKALEYIDVKEFDNIQEAYDVISTILLLEYEQNNTLTIDKFIHMFKRRK